MFIYEETVHLVYTSVSLQTTMGDQRFTCGRYKNRTFAEVASNDAEFCRAVLRTIGCSKYYPQDFKSYLLSLERPCERPSICENKVTSFLDKWDENMEAEFQQIIGLPEIEIKKVHPQASGHPNGNLGVFIRLFVRKCIFNVQKVVASHYSVETFAAIFPFKVSKTVPMARLAVRELFDIEFYATIAAFMVRHFVDKCDSAVYIIHLFLRNIHHFRETYFDEDSLRELKRVVDDVLDPEKRFFVATYANDYLKQFPRPSQEGVERYVFLRQTYNSLCEAFGCEGLGDQSRRHIRMLPEINCYELLSLLEPDFYLEQRATYEKRFQKYLFFFIYALESTDNPVFFIDDPLYECLKAYVQYQRSPRIPDSLKQCIWLVTLVHRRSQPLDYLRHQGLNFYVDDQNLQDIRNYVEKYPGIETAVVDFSLPTSLAMLGISIVTEDTIFNVCYRNCEKSQVSDFYEGIIRALMCPVNIKKVTIYNAYTGVETSMLVPPRKREVLEFIRRYNNYDPTRPIPVESHFTRSLEPYFEESTIQWDDKYPKSTSLPVYDYNDVFGDVQN